VWSHDFVSTRTHHGRSVRLLNLIDEHTRESLPRAGGTSLVKFYGDLSAGGRDGDEGSAGTSSIGKWPEFVAEDLRKWLAKTAAKALYIEPGSPWEDGYCESFNSKLRTSSLTVRSSTR
jgi:putative transposase